MSTTTTATPDARSAVRWLHREYRGKITWHAELPTTDGGTIALVLVKRRGMLVARFTPTGMLVGPVESFGTTKRNGIELRCPDVPLLRATAAERLQRVIASIKFRNTDTAQRFAAAVPELTFTGMLHIDERAVGQMGGLGTMYDRVVLMAMTMDGAPT